MAAFEKINLEKGMYQTGRSLTEILEELDPSEYGAGGTGRVFASAQAL